ncbi:DUF805 domain-containing protein [Labrys okinawensis]|uniref:DUF805 domain-containing protein n=1 Tax=Labrys okinawensis TaxID=346911 RepID=UPI0039BCB0CA
MSLADVSDDGPGPWQVLFSPKGRLPRLDTIFAFTCVLIVAKALASLWIGFAAAYRHRQDLEALLTPWVWGPVVIIGLVSAWSVACVLIKRCHDRDRSAWFVLIALVPLINLWPLIELFFLPGTPNLNHFGPPPRGMVQQWREANRDL